jgi:NADH-quinone oxidoreductase subunit H
MRLGMVFISLGIILGALFGLMSAAYLLGGWLEGLFAGGSHLAAVAIVMTAMVMVTATLLTLAERKWSSAMQDRVGPNRARLPIPGLKDNALIGLPHIAADVLKMLTKEAFRPKAASKFLFNLGPMLSFAPVFALFAVVPAGPTVTVMGKQVTMVGADPDFGLLFVFAIASLAVYGTSLAGWASNNKFGLLGGVRASSQMVSYEVALGLSLVGMMLAFSTVKLAGPTGMTDMQAPYLWSVTVGGFDIGVPRWGVFLQPLGFLLFFAAAFAETKRAPFDAPEGESEIVGYFIEYSGMQFGMFMIAEFVEVVVLSGVLAAIFFGGYHLPFGEAWLVSRPIFQEHGWLLGATLGTVFWIKVVLLCYLQLLIRWTFPRFRYDQIQSLSWKILLPLGLVNLFVSAALVLWDPSLQYLALFGFGVIGVVLFLTLTPPRQVRLQREADEAHGGHGHGDHHDDHHGAPHDRALPAANTH